MFIYVLYSHLSEDREFVLLGDGSGQSEITGVSALRLDDFRFSFSPLTIVSFSKETSGK